MHASNVNNKCKRTRAIQISNIGETILYDTDGVGEHRRWPKEVEVGYRTYVHTYRHILVVCTTDIGHTTGEIFLFLVFDDT